MSYIEVTHRVCNDCGGIAILMDGQELLALYKLNQNMEKIMSQLSDLQLKLDAAVAAAAQAMKDAAAKIDQLVATLANNPTAADVATLSADLSTQADALNAAAASLETHVAPAVAPGTEPTV